MTEIEEELIATLADVRRARNEAADLVVRTARERDAALARAEAAEAERDAAHRDWQEAWDRALAAEARIAAALALCDRWEQTSGDATSITAVRAALAEPVEPELSACATCNGFRFVCDFGGFTDACGDDRCVNDRRPCPSCTPPDPESETR